MILSAEELHSRLLKAKQTKRDLRLNDEEATSLICLLHFYKRLFDKLNINLDHRESPNEPESTGP